MVHFLSVWTILTSIAVTSSFLHHVFKKPSNGKKVMGQLIDYVYYRRNINGTYKIKWYSNPNDILQSTKSFN